MKHEGPGKRLVGAVRVRILLCGSECGRRRYVPALTYSLFGFRRRYTGHRPSTHDSANGACGIIKSGASLYSAQLSPPALSVPLHTTSRLVGDCLLQPTGSRKRFKIRLPEMLAVSYPGDPLQLFARLWESRGGLKHSPNLRGDLRGRPECAENVDSEPHDRGAGNLSELRRHNARCSAHVNHAIRPAAPLLDEASPVEHIRDHGIVYSRNYRRIRCEGTG